MELAKRIAEIWANFTSKPEVTVAMVVTVAVFTVLALKGKIDPDNVMIVVSMVVSFYFGTQHEKTLK